MPLSEPLTTVTDYALAAASLGFAVSIGRQIRPRNRVSGWFWRAAFVAAAIAAAVGGTYHGFVTRLAPTTVRELWNITMFSMGACGAFLTAAARMSRVRRGDGTVTWLVWGIVVTLFGAAVQKGALSSLAPWNPNASYHLIQILGLYCFFRCAREARDRPGSVDDEAADAPQGGSAGSRPSRSV